MNTFLALCSLLIMRLAAGDVSHLNMKYLPPMMRKNELSHGNGHNAPMPQKTTTTIEKQLLRELPEQIEYGQSAQYGSDMLPMMNNMLMTMMHNDVTMTMPMPMPADIMQPPPMGETMAPADFSNAPSMHYLPPHMNQQQSTPAMPRMQYLPPTFMPASQFQQGMQQMPQVHPSMAAPLSPDMPEIEKQHMMEYTQAEPQPAHTLTPEGYQYKTGATFSTPASRFNSVSATRQFRLKQ